MVILDMTQLIEGDNNFRYDEEGYEDAGFTKTEGEDIDNDIFEYLRGRFWVK